MPPCTMRLCLLSLLALALAAHAASTQPVRFWLDDAYFSPAETFFLRTEIAKSEGRLSITGELQTRAPLAINGANALHEWDVYFTARTNCYKALPWVQWPKRVNCLPGAESITLKKSLVFTLQAAYGDDAFTLIPRSYLMPEQLGVWQAWSDEVQAPLDETWVLKANIHRGKGVHLHDLGSAQENVYNSASFHSKRAHKGRVRPAAEVPPSYVLAQQYIRNQFLYAGRQSYVRVWAVITSVTPLRLYMYQGGVVIFGKQPVNSTSVSATHEQASGSQQGPGQIVNLWQLERGQSLTWSLAELRAHITQVTYQQNQQILMQQQLAQLKQQQQPAGTSGRGLLSLDDIPRAAMHLDDDDALLSLDDITDLHSSMHSSDGDRHDMRMQGSGHGDAASAAHSVNQSQQAGPHRSLLQGSEFTRRRKYRQRSGPSSPPQPPRITLASPEQRFRRMWKQMHRAVGLAVAAGLPHMREAEKHLDHLTGPGGWATDAWSVQADGSGGVGPKLPQPEGFNTHQVDEFWQQAKSKHAGNLHAARQHVYHVRPAGYEVLGADFLLDADFTPKLVEINALPSSAPERTCASRQACDEAIQKFVANELNAMSEAAGYHLPTTALPADAENDRHMQHINPLLPHSSFDKEKHGLVHDLLGLLGLPVHANGPSEARPAAAADVEEDIDGNNGRKLMKADDRHGESTAHDLVEADGVGAQVLGLEAEARRVLTQQPNQFHDVLAAKYNAWAEHVQSSLAEHHRREARQKWPALGDELLHSGDYGPASKHAGLGATLVLVAALLGQSAPPGSSNASRAAAEAVVSTIGGMYPSALQAAEKAAPAVYALMCPGLNQLPNDLVMKGSTAATTALTAVLPEDLRREDLDDAKQETCVKSCFYLDELQVMGEQEMEMSSRGAFQRLAPLKEAILRNKVALMLTRGSDTAKPQRLQPGWMSSLSSWLSSLGNNWMWSGDGHQVLASHVIETATPLDEVTQAAMHARMAMANDGSLHKCTRNLEVMSACVVQMLRRMLNDWCMPQAPNRAKDHEG